MRPLAKFLFTVIIISFLFSCSEKQEAELIIINGSIYTVDDNLSKANAMAISDGKILGIGTDEEINKSFKSENVIDLEQKPVYPGFYDAHCHFFGYAENLRRADLKGLTSFDAVVEAILAHREKYPNDTWILGRGWDQNLWTVKEFPTKAVFDSLFPNTPVMLTRVDGHAVLVNQTILDLAEIGPETVIEGGQVIVKDGKCTGVLLDKAEELINDIMPIPPTEVRIQSWKEAEENCLAVGLTTLVDAGLPLETIFMFDSLQRNGAAKIKLYPMLQPTEEGFEYAANKGMYKTDRMNLRSFKIYSDGALGSRGACLLEPYSDDAPNTGFLLSSKEYFEDAARRINLLGFQMNTHAIGDSANRTILDIYMNALEGKEDSRWRIEHAQVLDPNDFAKFGKGKIIPSVQPTHCTSDMDWADERLGRIRIQFAYAYKTLLNSAGIVALGSDFPVEEINPLLGFHAAIARVAADGHPEGGFQMKDALTREEALKGMTIWAAYSSFEEDEKGSLEVGKWADFVVLDKDIMEIDPMEILDTKVQETWINGERVYTIN